MLKRIAMILGVLLAGIIGTASSASAAVDVRGTVTCANSSVSGVWIQAENGGSGWADWEMPIRLNGLNQADYRYTLPWGGRYQVHVGCGGTPQRWARDVKSGYVSGTYNSFICNDIPTWLRIAGTWVLGRIGLSFIKMGDMPRYMTCRIT